MTNLQIFKPVRSKKSNLEQGDLILDLTIPVTTITDATSIQKMKKSARLDWNGGDFVILTQSCDLDPNNDKQLSTIVLAPVLTVTKFVLNNPYYRVADRFRSIVKNKKQNFYCVPPPSNAKFDSNELLILVLDSPVIVQLDLVKMQIEHRTSAVKRFRMLSPFSEDLSNTFAYQFERVPLPQRVYPPEDFQLSSIQKLSELREANFNEQ